MSLGRIIPIQAGTGPRVVASGVTRFTQLPPLSVYVHVPWCVRKCPYCDFNSHQMPAELPEADYLDALAADLEQVLPQVWGRKVVSVFLGGGTPSLLSAGALDQLLAMLRAFLPLLPDAEITLEANPGTVETARFQSYAASGVNRISLGVQSFNDTALKALGRVHDGASARAAVAAAQQAVERVNLDLMTALPGQDVAAALTDLRTALAFGTEHLSLYQLTMEPNTVFAKYPPAGLPDDDLGAEIHDAVAAEAQAAGYERYEVSAYAKPGARSQHNLNYWEFGDYIGIGPGAHAKLSFPDRIERSARLRQPESWMAAARRRDGSHLAEQQVVSDDDLPFEFMLNVLRLHDGVPAAQFTERTGLSLAACRQGLARGVALGLLVDDPSRIQPTAQGWRFLNDLQGLFL